MEKILKSGIYCIENKLNHKKYIGQSKDIQDRWKDHKYNLNKGVHANSHLQNSWNKYGEDSFEFYILIECSHDMLDYYEVLFMDEFKALNPKYGYNKKTGGTNGQKYSLESRTKMSNSHIELCKSKEIRDKMSDAGKKVWEDNDYRASRSGENHPLYGKHLSNETKEKLSRANKGKKKPPRTDSHRKAISEAKKGKEPPNKNETKVKCLENNVIYNSAIEAGKALGLKHPNHVIDVCMGRRNSCEGYHFIFIEE